MSLSRSTSTPWKSGFSASASERVRLAVSRWCGLGPRDAARYGQQWWGGGRTHRTEMSTPFDRSMGCAVVPGRVDGARLSRRLATAGGGGTLHLCGDTTEVVPHLLDLQVKISAKQLDRVSCSPWASNKKSTLRSRDASSPPSHSQWRIRSGGNHRGRAGGDLRLREV